MSPCHPPCSLVQVIIETYPCFEGVFFSCAKRGIF
jgi:hypothetical protein